MKLLARAVVFVVLALNLPGCGPQPSGTFEHGIASGDPLADSVIIWTRVTPMPEAAAPAVPLPVQWVVATDEALTDVMAKGKVEATAEADYTVKVDVTGLKPGATYFYRFNSGEAVTATGRTRTLPEGKTERVSFAAVSCSNFPYGYFNVYKAIADRDDIDAVLHLGDYYYEYGPKDAFREVGERLGRMPDPAHETVTLEDYRRRHAQYRTDQDLQAMTARHPLIVVWDDHESTNDSSKDAAQNHQPDEGDWQERKRASVRAYAEWLPIRVPDPADPLKIYRSFDYGDLVSLMMLDTRLAGRAPSLEYDDAGAVPLVGMPFDFTDPAHPVPAAPSATGAAIKVIPVPFDVSGDAPVPVLDYARIVEYGALAKNEPAALPDGVTFMPDLAAFRAKVLDDPTRRMLGAEQEEWLRQRMDASKQAGKPWQVLAQQVLVGSLGMPDLSPEMRPMPHYGLTAARVKLMGMLAAAEMPMNLDAWDGYPAARRDLATDIRAHAENAVILAGDTHNFFAFDLDKAPGETPYAVEFGAASVNSPGMEQYLPVPPQISAERLLRSSRQLRWIDSSNRGYALLTLTPERASSRFYVVDTVLSREFKTTCAAAFEVEPVPGPGVAPLRTVSCE
jgi:alkaline phosphatase D